MKIIVSAAGRFHAFYWAEQIQKKGYLCKMIAGYYSPKINAKGIEINPSRIASSGLPDILAYVFRRFFKKYVDLNIDWYFKEFYDRWASRQVEPCDILVGWSGSSLHTIRRARELGVVTVVHRGSAHILTQEDLIQYEYAKFGIQKKVIDKRIIDKELKEYELADYIHTPSSFAKQTFINRGFPDYKIFVVPNGFSVKHFKSIPKLDDIFRVIHVGPSVRKGTHYLLQAMDELGLPSSEVLLIGRPEGVLLPLLDECKCQVKLIERVPHIEMWRYYSMGSLYCLPSIEDGFANVIVEAMACGLPVICSENVGAKDSVRKGIDGFVVPVRDVEALKEKILYLYEHEKERKEMGRNALERAKEFTWDRYGERMVEAYKKILSSKGGKRCLAK